MIWIRAGSYTDICSRPLQIIRCTCLEIRGQNKNVVLISSPGYPVEEVFGIKFYCSYQTCEILSSSIFQSRTPSFSWPPRAAGGRASRKTTTCSRQRQHRSSSNYAILWMWRSRLWRRVSPSGRRWRIG